MLPEHAWNSCNWTSCNFQSGSVINGLCCFDSIWLVDKKIWYGSQTLFTTTFCLYICFNNHSDFKGRFLILRLKHLIDVEQSIKHFAHSDLQGTGTTCTYNCSASLSLLISRFFIGYRSSESSFV